MAANGPASAVITGRSSPVVEKRAAEVGIEFVFQGAAEKGPVYRRLLEQTGTRLEEVCYVGDDLPDLPALRSCGLAVAVADACPEVRHEGALHQPRCGRPGRSARGDRADLALSGRLANPGAALAEFVMRMMANG